MYRCPGLHETPPRSLAPPYLRFQPLQAALALNHRSNLTGLPLQLQRGVKKKASGLKLTKNQVGLLFETVQFMSEANFLASFTAPSLRATASTIPL